MTDLGEMKLVWSCVFCRRDIFVGLLVARLCTRKVRKPQDLRSGRKQSPVAFVYRGMGGSVDFLFEVIAHRMIVLG